MISMPLCLSLPSVSPPRVSSVIANGTVSIERRKGKEPRHVITYGNKKAFITKNFRGTQTTCVLTAYEAD